MHLLPTGIFEQHSTHDVLGKTCPELLNLAIGTVRR